MRSAIPCFLAQPVRGRKARTAWSFLGALNEPRTVVATQVIVDAINSCPSCSCYLPNKTSTETLAGNMGSAALDFEE